MQPELQRGESVRSFKHVVTHTLSLIFRLLPRYVLMLKKKQKKKTCSNVIKILQNCKLASHSPVSN